MDRPTLKKWYNVAIAAALGVGFAVGYTLRNPEVTGAKAPDRHLRDYERDFPGADQEYRRLLKLFAQGNEVRSDYGALLEQVDEAIEKQPDFVPFAVIRSAIWEDWLCNLQDGRLSGEKIAELAGRVGLSEDAAPDTVADGLRRNAIETWLAVERSPLIQEQEKYGERWHVLWEQNLNALRQEQVVRTPVLENGLVDLARAFNAFALTRDFVRYPNNLSEVEDGYSFEEKHIDDVLFCPQHRDVAFQLPCLQYLEPNRGGTIRRSLEMFRTGMRITGQKLDVDAIPVARIHLLAFNTTLDKRIVDAQLRVLYADGVEERKAFRVPPWQQSESMLRDIAARQALDPVHRDSEVHLANGSELNLPASPFYMYHVAVDIDSNKRLDEIYFPRHDPTTAGLEDEGINDICIVAMTVEQE